MTVQDGLSYYIPLHQSKNLIFVDVNRVPCEAPVSHAKKLFNLSRTENALISATPLFTNVFWNSTITDEAFLNDI